MRILDTENIPIHLMVSPDGDEVRIAAWAPIRALELAQAGHRDIVETSSGRILPIPPKIEV